MVDWGWGFSNSNQCIQMQLVCSGLVVQTSPSIPNCLSTQENPTPFRGHHLVHYL